MPFVLPALSRRHALAGLAASVAAGATINRSPAAAAGPQRFALLSDTHIPARPQTQHGSVNMTAQLAEAVRRIAAATERPSAAFFAGDISYLHGLRYDYSLFATVVDPLRAAGIPAAVILGNHDDRDNFRRAFRSVSTRIAAPPDRHVGVVETRWVNWFLLDSLEIVDETPGLLGSAQIGWLDEALTAHSGKPACVIVHHNPDTTGGKNGVAWFGMKDTEQLFAVLRKHPHAKVLFHGHTHDYKITRSDLAPITIVNLPPTAYVFDPKAPIGWIDAVADERGVRLTLQSLDLAHPLHGTTTAIAWDPAMSAVSPQ